MIFRYSEVIFYRKFFRICVKRQLIVNINCTVGNKFIIIPAHLIFIWNYFRNSNSKTTQKTVRKSKSKVLNQIQLSLKISKKGWNRIRMTKNKTDTNISDKNWTQNNFLLRQSSIIILLRVRFSMLRGRDAEKWITYWVLFSYRLFWNPALALPSLSLIWLDKGAQGLTIFKPPILKFSGYFGIEMMTQVSWFLKLIETAPVNRTEIFKPILHICPRLHLNSNSTKSEKIWIKQVKIVRFSIP